MDGWIKIHRSITEHWIFSNPYYFQWWIDMLLMANIRENKVVVGSRLIDLGRGQMIASLSFLATRWKVSKERVRRYLRLLQSENMIVTKHDGKATQITICNYASYQDVRDDNETIARQQRDDSETIARLNIRNKERKNNNKKENIKEKKPEIPPLSPKGEIPSKLSQVIRDDYADAMSEWLEYKRAKKQSYKSDNSIKLCYNKLLKLSGGDAALAMEIVHQSMANNWQGLFPLKEEENNSNNIVKYESANEQRERERAERDAAVAKHIQFLLATNEVPQQ